jgi:hypothetical protein
MATKIITAFAGVNTSFNARDIAENAAGDMVNVIVEDGEIAPRPGYNAKAAAQANFVAAYCLDYVQGYDSSTEREEYITVEDLGGTTKAYTRNVNTLAATELTNGGSGITLHASEWLAVAFREYAYLINPNNSSAPVIRHAIGTNNSMTPMAVPADPTTAPTYRITYGGGSTPYTQLDFAGVNPATEVTYTGAAHSTDSSVDTDNSIIIGHANDDIASSVEFDLNSASAGVQNYTNRDRFATTLTTLDRGFRLNPSSIRVEFRNNDGSPVTLVPDELKVDVIAGANTYRYVVRWAWTAKDRTLFDNVRYVKIYYTVEASDGDLANRLRIAPIWEGGVQMVQPASSREPGTGGVYVAYTYLFSTPGFESGLSPILFIPNSVLGGYSPGNFIEPLGVNVEITMTASADTNVDNFRIYVQDNGRNIYKFVATQSDADLTYDLNLTYTEIVALTQTTPAPFTFGNVTAMFPHKGSVVWLYDQGDENVRYSRVGEPIKQASDFDSEEDLNRGATFTLADNFGDKPLGGVSVGDGVMIAGKYGVHYQLGDYPSQMTFPRKTAGSFGVAGKRAFCRYKSDDGVVGMAYVSPNGQVYFAVPGSGSGDGDNVSLTDSIRDGEKSLRSWLLDGQASLGFTDFSTVQVKVDDRDDTLVIIMGKRGLRLRRPDQTGNRSWHPEEYNTGGDSVTIKYLASAPKWGIRWIRSNGKVDESEFNNADRVYIGGVNRDGGNPMPTGYWRSKVFAGSNRRIKRVYLQRSPIHVDAGVKVLSLRIKQLYRIPENKLFVNCAPLQQGFDHQFEIRVTETTGRISELRWEEEALGKRTNL